MPATTTETLAALITRIVESHHVYLRNELPFLEERIAKMCRNHGHEIPHFFEVQQLLQNLRDDLMAHLEKEEQILFPYIQGMEQWQSGAATPPNACFPSIRFPIRVMLQEHDGAKEILSQLRAVTGNYSKPDGLCENAAEFFRRLEALEADLHEHIRVENDELFPRAVQLEAA